MVAAMGIMAIPVAMATTITIIMVIPMDITTAIAITVTGTTLIADQTGGSR
jgi:hypothetical protein